MENLKKFSVNPLDTMWRLMESKDTPMHVGVLAIFKLPANAKDSYLTDMADHFRTFRKPVPPWNCRWVGGKALQGGVLEEVKNIDIDYHFRHLSLPQPGGERQLGVMISRLHSHPMSFAYPLWEFHLIEGLEDNRFAFYIKLHRSVLKSISAIPLLMSALSSSSRKRKMPPFWAIPQKQGASEKSERDLNEFINDALESVVNVGRDMVRSIQQPAELASYLLPGKTPRSTLNRRINYHRRFATQQFDLKRVKRVARASGSRIEDILVYIISTALRRFFKEYNALPDEPLIAGVPVELHELDHSEPGNAIAGLRLSLATNLGDSEERLEAVKRSVEALKEDWSSLPDHAVSAYTWMRSLPIYGSQLPGVGRLVPPLFNLSISGLISTEQKPMYFQGAKLQAVYPLNALLQYSALSIDIVIYNDTFNVGYTGARDTLPAIQRMAVYTGKALQDLECMYASELEEAES